MGINDLVIPSISKILMQIETHLGKDTDKGSVQFQKLPNIWATFVEIWSPIPLKNSPNLVTLKTGHNHCPFSHRSHSTGVYYKSRSLFAFHDNGI